MLSRFNSTPARSNSSDRLDASPEPIRQSRGDRLPGRPPEPDAVSQVSAAFAKPRQRRFLGFAAPKQTGSGSRTPLKQNTCLRPFCRGPRPPPPPPSPPEPFPGTTPQHPGFSVPGGETSTGNGWMPYPDFRNDFGYLVVDLRVRFDRVGQFFRDLAGG